MIDGRGDAGRIPPGAAARLTLTGPADPAKEGAVRPGGQPNLQQLMKQAQKMQQQMVDVQAELAETEVTGTSGGGLVTVTLTGTGEVTAVKIDPKAVDIATLPVRPKSIGGGYSAWRTLEFGFPSGNLRFEI